MDHFLTLNPTIQNGENLDSDPRWIDVWQYSNNMLEDVTGQTIEEFNLEGYEREPASPHLARRGRADYSVSYHQIIR